MIPISHEEYLAEPLDMAEWVPRFAHIEDELQADEVKRQSKGA